MRSYPVKENHNGSVVSWDPSVQRDTHTKKHPVTLLNCRSLRHKHKSQKKHQESAAVNAMFTITNIFFLFVENIKTKGHLFSKGFKKEKLPFI